MDQRMQNIFHNIENNSLGLDDTFQFECRECGKCCKNRKDILLTTQDLYNIAKYLGRMIDEIVGRYCYVYIGESSRIPVVKLNPVGSDNVCPLLRDKHCIVHKVKPIVCALFPLGRAVVNAPERTEAKNTDNIKPQYFIQPIKCGLKTQTHTVRDWLGKFDVPIEDEFYSLWTSAILFLSEYFTELEDQKMDCSVIKRFWNITYMMLYLGYDASIDFIPQFRDRIPQLKYTLIGLKKKAEELG